MSAELSEWIAELSSSRAASPGAAAEVGAALTAVLDAADLLALPAVADLAGPSLAGADPREAADLVYQELLDALTQLRRQVAEAAVFRSAHRSRITPAEVAAAEARERALTERMQECQRWVDQFRVTKETAKAQFTAAEAVCLAQSALALAEDAAAEDHPGDDAAQDSNGREDAEFAAAAERLGALIADGSQLAARVLAAGSGGAHGAPAGDGSHGTAHGAVAADGNGHGAIAAGLLELRADPLGSDARLLFAEEPAGTITLLAVLDDVAAAREHRAAAIGLAGDLLTRVRASGWPAADDDQAAREVCFATSGTFLARYFPLSAAQVRERAAEIATTVSLRTLRAERGLSLADVVERTGIDAADVRRLEAGGLSDAPVRHVVAYARALGSRLTLTATDTGGAGRRLS